MCQIEQLPISRIGTSCVNWCQTVLKMLQEINFYSCWACDGIGGLYKHYAATFNLQKEKYSFCQ